MKAILRLALAASLLAAPHTAAAQVIRTVSSDRCSGAITTGGTSQVATNADSSRGWLVIQNPTTATEPLFVDFGPNHPASATLSTGLAPGGSMSFLAGVVPVSQVNVMAATAGHAFVCLSGR